MEMIQNNTQLELTTKFDIYDQMRSLIDYSDLVLDYEAKYYKQIKDNEIIGYLVVSADKLRHNVISVDGKVEYFES